MILAAKALLDHNPAPSRADVIDAISGNICRCTGYEPIIAAILSAAAEMRASSAAGTTPRRAVAAPA
jgi:carbon-monoxide dehydrogenase small subunit